MKSKGGNRSWKMTKRQILGFKLIRMQVVVESLTYPRSLPKVREKKK